MASGERRRGLYELPILTQDEHVSVGCGGCYDCCSNVETVITGYDFYRIVSHLNQPAEDIFRRFFVLGHAQGSLFPVLSFNLENGEGFCPFLKMGHCEVYRARPFVCRLYPVLAAPNLFGELAYRICDTCTGLNRGRKRSLKAWLKENLSDNDEQYQRLYWKFVARITILETQLPDAMPDKDLELLYGRLAENTYFLYDFTSNYEMQFKKNSQESIAEFEAAARWMND